MVLSKKPPKFTRLLQQARDIEGFEVLSILNLSHRETEMVTRILIKFPYKG